MKKRYMFTLTQGNVEKFQELCKEAGLPYGTVSVAVDDFIKGMIPVMKNLNSKSGAGFSICDFFKFIGKEQYDLGQLDLDLSQYRGQFTNKEKIKNHVEQKEREEKAA